MTYRFVSKNPKGKCLENDLVKQSVRGVTYQVIDNESNSTSKLYPTFYAASIMTYCVRK